MSSAAGRALRIRRLLRKRCKARAVCRKGAYPQATWGGEAFGLAPTQVRKLRRQACLSASVPEGFCTTTALFFHFGPFNEPSLHHDQGPGPDLAWQALGPQDRRLLGPTFGQELWGQIPGEWQRASLLPWSRRAGTHRSQAAGSVHEGDLWQAGVPQSGTKELEHELGQDIYSGI